MDGQEVVAKRQGTVPPNMPQTSQAAEQCGRAAAVQLLSGPSTLIGDCQPVVAAARSSHLHALHHSKIHAGARLLAVTSGNCGRIECDRWVKSHREVDAAVDEPDRLDIIGNRAADRGAVDAQSMHWWPSGDFHKIIEYEQQQLLCIIKVLVSTVVLWPSHRKAADKEDSASRAVPPKKPVQPATRPHIWQFRGRSWYCCRCLSIAHCSATKQKRDREECTGCSVKIMSVVAYPQGHLLLGAEDETGAPVIACARCGAWATKHPRNLAQPCPRVCRVHSSAHYALLRMARRRHPDSETNRAICEPVVLDEEHKRDATEVLDAFLATNWHTRAPTRRYSKLRSPEVCPQGNVSNERLEAVRQRVLRREQAASAPTNR